MSIKKSSLEQKWYYRVAKIFFLLLPFFVVAIIFYKGYLNIDISQKNVGDILQKNSIYIVYVVGGLVLYFLILKGIWRGFLYITFGGLEDDTQKKVVIATQSANPTIQPAPVKNNGLGVAIFLIFLIIFLIYITTYTDTVPSYTGDSGGGGGNKNSQCIPTGCGSLYRCSGDYYLSGVRTGVTGCFPLGSRPSDIYSGWSGTCRQCP